MRFESSIDESEPNEPGPEESDPGSLGGAAMSRRFSPADGVCPPSVRLPAFTGSLAAHREGRSR
jgi:hypothetical protein